MKLSPESKAALQAAASARWAKEGRRVAALAPHPMVYEPLLTREEMEPKGGCQSRYKIPTVNEARAQVWSWKAEAQKANEQLMGTIEEERIYTTGVKGSKPAGTWRAWCWYFGEPPKRHGYHECLRCNYRWLGRDSFQGDRGLPKRCPSCRSPLWNTHRINRAGQGRPKLYVVTKLTCS